MKHKLRITIDLVILVLIIMSLAWGSRLHAQGTQHSITVAWSYIQGTDIATGFNVYRSLTSGTGYAKLNSSAIPITTLSYSDTQGIGGTKYFYIVTAVDATGNESGPSLEVNATFLVSPAVPGGITAVAK